ncbi:DUF2737 family protein [Salmonella enterica subsp. enterica serovar Heidelberg]|nr:DUF2737 family protein [Salmonella enterica subsp. enterica serovar Heidelberg]
MRGLSYDPGILPSEMIIRHRFKPINDIPREEMLKRNSFGIAGNGWLGVYRNGSQICSSGTKSPD